MRPNPQFPADLITFTEEIFSEKFHFLCSDMSKKSVIKFHNHSIYFRKYSVATCAKFQE